MQPFLPDSIQDPLLPPLKPKDAATLILVRRQAGVARVLMGQRHRSHVFLPGNFVFPGGEVETADRRLRLTTDLRPEVQAKVALGIDRARARALALAAIRETFEETGHLVGIRSTAKAHTRSPAWRLFLGHGVVPHLEALDFVARAVTPPRRPRRFDARFFMVGTEHIAHSLDKAQASGELLQLSWLTLREARDLPLTPITHCIIEEIEARLADGSDPARPVPFHMMQRGKAVKMLL